MEEKNNIPQKIKSLHPANYSIFPRTQERFVGENAAWRYFNPKDRKDIKNLQKIVNNPEVQKWMRDVANLSEKEIIEWANEQGQPPKENSHLFAIVSSSKLPENYRGQYPISEIIGFRYFYFDKEEEKEVRKMVKLDLINESETHGKILSMSAAKIDPKAPPHQIASATRQLLFEMNKIMEDVNLDDKKTKPDMLIYSLTETSDDENHVNANSRRVLEACGFEKRGIMTETINGKVEQNFVYVLNWEKLDEILKGKTVPNFDPQTKELTWENM